MKTPSAFDPGAVLTKLVEHQVDFVIIGGLGAYLHAAPISTHDLDVVYAQTFLNYQRLERALAELDTIYRDPMGRRISPTAQHLGRAHGAGHHLRETRHGWVDVLRSSGEFDFERLAAKAVNMEVEGVAVRVARLEDIIEMKQRANRPKDQLALPTLRAVLEDDRQNDD